VRMGRGKRRASEHTAAEARPGGDDLRDRHGDGNALNSLEAVIRRHVLRVVARSATFTEAAQRLGIDLTTLWRMRKRWGLD